MKEHDVAHIVALIDKVLTAPENKLQLRAVKQEVNTWMQEFSFPI
jgi:glycine/serine hydroxymethyltransferase